MFTCTPQHPASVLSSQSGPGLDGPDPVNADASIAVLRAYEARNGVTFAALNDALMADVRQAYGRWADGDPYDESQRLHDLGTLARRVGELLGLGSPAERAAALELRELAAMNDAPGVYDPFPESPYIPRAQ